MARRRGRSVSRGPKNNIWTVVILDVVSITTSVTEANIVEPDDWQPSTSGFERATLLRIRGWLCAASIPTDVNAASLMAMIYVCDADDSVNSPSAVASYTKEDVLWSYGWSWPGANAASVEKPSSTTVMVDVKAMRKISSAQEVRLSVVGSDATTATVSGVLRALIRKGGN